MSGDKSKTTLVSFSRSTVPIRTQNRPMESTEQGGHADPRLDDNPQVCDEPAAEAEYAPSYDEQMDEEDLEELLGRREHMDVEDSPGQDRQDTPSSPSLTSDAADVHATTANNSPARAPERTPIPNGDGSAQIEEIATNQSPTLMEQDMNPPPSPLHDRQSAPPSSVSETGSARQILESRAPAAPQGRVARRAAYVQGRLNFSSQQPSAHTSSTTQPTVESATCGEDAETHSAAVSEHRGTAEPARSDARTRDGGFEDMAHSVDQQPNPASATRGAPEIPDSGGHGTQREIASVLDTHTPPAGEMPAGLDIEEPESLGKLVFYPHLKEGDIKPRITAATLLASLEMAVADEGADLEWWTEYFASARGYRGVTSIAIGADESWAVMILPNNVCAALASHIGVLTVDTLPDHDGVPQMPTFLYVAHLFASEPEELLVARNRLAEHDDARPTAAELVKSDLYAVVVLNASQACVLVRAKRGHTSGDCLIGETNDTDTERVGSAKAVEIHKKQGRRYWHTWHMRDH